MHVHICIISFFSSTFTYYLIQLSQEVYKESGFPIIVSEEAQEGLVASLS